MSTAATIMYISASYMGTSIGEVRFFYDNDNCTNPDNLIPSSSGVTDFVHMRQDVIDGVELVVPDTAENIYMRIFGTNIACNNCLGPLETGYVAPPPTATPTPTPTATPTPTPTPTPSPTLQTRYFYRIVDCNSGLNYLLSKTSYCVNSNLTNLNQSFTYGEVVQYKLGGCGGATYCGTIIDTNFTSTSLADGFISNLVTYDCQDIIHCNQ